MKTKSKTKKVKLVTLVSVRQLQYQSSASTLACGAFGGVR